MKNLSLLLYLSAAALLAGCDNNQIATPEVAQPSSSTEPSIATPPPDVTTADAAAQATASFSFNARYAFPEGTSESWIVSPISQKPQTITSIAIQGTADGEESSDGYHWQELYVWLSPSLPKDQVQGASKPANVVVFAPQKAMGNPDPNSPISAQRDSINQVIPAGQQVKIWVEHRSKGAKNKALNLLVQTAPGG